MDIIATGNDAKSLEKTVNELPPGDYQLLLSRSDGDYTADLTIRPVEPEGVGVFPFLWAGGALLGGLLGWQILRETRKTSEALTDIPKWVWYVGGAALVLLLWNPVMNMVNPTRKYQQVPQYAPPPQYYPPAQPYYPPQRY